MNERRRERLARWIGPLIGLVLLIVAAVALERELAGANLEDILAHVRAVPARHAAAAIGLTVAGYVALTGYDALALRRSTSTGNTLKRIPRSNVDFNRFTLPNLP